MLRLSPSLGRRIDFSFSGDKVNISPRLFSITRWLFLKSKTSCWMTRVLHPFSLSYSRNSMLSISALVYIYVFILFIKLTTCAPINAMVLELEQLISSIYSPTLTIGEERQRIIRAREFLDRVIRTLFIIEEILAIRSKSWIW